MYKNIGIIEMLHKLFLANLMFYIESNYEISVYMFQIQIPIKFRLKGRAIK